MLGKENGGDEQGGETMRNSPNCPSSENTCVNTVLIIPINDDDKFSIRSLLVHYGNDSDNMAWKETIE